MQKELRFKTNSFLPLIGFVPTIITSGILIFGQDAYIPLYRRFKTALSNFPDNYRFDTDHLFFIGFCVFVLIFENNDPTDFSITGYMHNNTIYIDQNDIEYVVNENHRG